MVAAFRKLRLSLFQLATSEITAVHIYSTFRQTKVSEEIVVGSRNDEILAVNSGQGNHPNSSLTPQTKKAPNQKNAFRG
jgi:hypothetical protein